MERNSQSTGFSQHEKARFNIQELKSWLNERACVRVFFETHYGNTKRGSDLAEREEDRQKAHANTCTQRTFQRTSHYALKRAKTHAPRRSPLLSGTAETIETQSRD
jgi:hypothetical protein